MAKDTRETLIGVCKLCGKEYGHWAGIFKFAEGICKCKVKGRR